MGTRFPTGFTCSSLFAVGNNATTIRLGEAVDFLSHIGHDLSLISLHDAYPSAFTTALRIRR
jgi:hypothetical protein